MWKKNLIAFLIWVCVAGTTVASAAAERTATNPDTSAALVVPIDWSRFKEPAKFDKDYRQCRDILLNCARYNLAWAERTFKQDQSRRMYILTGMNESGVRPACSAVYSLAPVLKAGVFDEKVVGISREQALERTIKMLRAAAATHKVNKGRGGWGDHWQSALWAGLMGFGGHMLWDELDQQTQRMVSGVVVHEADRFINFKVPYWNGKGGDTKAEENAWNSLILNVAVAMMPRHTRVRQWKEKSSELMVSAYATKEDWQKNNTVLDGRPVKKWLNGYNALPGGVVINHSRYHPDYMAAYNINLWSYLTQSMSGGPVPETGDFNAALVYDSFVTKNWSSPPYDSPGGTIFVPNDPYLYYPKGTDWSTYDLSMYYLCDVWTHLLGWDGGLPQQAVTWMRLRATKMLWMQERHTNRKMFAPGEYETYPGTEQWVAYQIADSFLALWLDAHNAMGTKSNWLAGKSD